MSETDQTAELLSRAAPGQLLAEAREARGWSVNEMAMRLKFSIRQIEALEADAYNALSGPSMVRGMVRSYAKAVGLDSKPLIMDLEQRLNADPLTIMAKLPMHVPLRESPKKGTRLYIGLSLILVLVVAGLVFQWRSEPDQPQVSVAAAPAQPKKNKTPAPVAIEAAPVLAPVEAMPAQQVEAAPTISPPPPVYSAPAAGKKRIEFSFEAESWVEVKDGSGRMLMSQLNSPQSERVLEGEPPFTLLIGNAGTVRLVYEGKPVDLQSATRQDVARLTLN